MPCCRLFSCLREVERLVLGRYCCCLHNKIRPGLWFQCVVPSSMNMLVFGARLQPPLSSRRSVITYCYRRKFSELNVTPNTPQQCIRSRAFISACRKKHRALDHTIHTETRRRCWHVRPLPPRGAEAVYMIMRIPHICPEWSSSDALLSFATGGNNAQTRPVHTREVENSPPPHTVPTATHKQESSFPVPVEGSIYYWTRHIAPPPRGWIATCGIDTIRRITPKTWDLRFESRES